MKSLVVYDSQYGNTRRLAKAIAAELEAGGTDVQVECARIEELAIPADVTLLVVGGPTQAHSVSPPLKEQLDTIGIHQLDGVSAATFDTRARGPRILTGAASVGIAKLLKQRGAQLVVDAESFLVEGTHGPLVEGELERARTWAREVLAKLTPNAEPATVG